MCLGGWRAHPRGAAEHLLGSTPTNQAPDARWQWKISSQPVTAWSSLTQMCWCRPCKYNSFNSNFLHNIRESQTKIWPLPVLYTVAEETGDGPVACVIHDCSDLCSFCFTTICCSQENKILDQPVKHVRHVFFLSFYGRINKLIKKMMLQPYSKI